MIRHTPTIPLFSAAVVTFALLVSREARADVKHVVLSTPPGAEVTERLRAELALKGFRVSMFGSLPSGCFGDDLANVAKGADAAVCVDTSVHVFVRKDDKLPHTDTVASVDASDIAAMRAAEIVRVRLELASMPEPPPPPPPQEIVVRVEDHEHLLDQDLIQEIPKGPPPQIRLAAAGGVLLDASGQSTGDSSYLFTGVSAIYRPGSVPGLQPIFTGALASTNAGVKAGTLTLGLRYRLAQEMNGRVAFYFGPNLGAFLNRDIYDPTHKQSKASPTLGLESSIEGALTDYTSLAATIAGSYLLDENAAIRAPLMATVGVHMAL